MKRDGPAPTFSQRRATDGFEAASRKLLRAIKDATPEQLEPVGDAIRALINAYNNLVSVSNTLYSLEQAGGLK